MSDLWTEISAIFAIVLGTVGTTDVTLGLVAVLGILIGVSVRFYRSVKR